MELKFEELLSLIEELDENDKKEFELEEFYKEFS